jgi:hypothetical protein
MKRGELSGQILNAHRAGVGEHGERLKLGDGLGDVGVLLLGGLRVVAPQVARVGPAHPAACVLLELACGRRQRFSGQICESPPDSCTARASYLVTLRVLYGNMPLNARLQTFSNSHLAWCSPAVRVLPAQCCWAWSGLQWPWCDPQPGAQLQHLALRIISTYRCAQAAWHCASL